MTLAFLASTSFSFKPHFIVLTCTHSKIATFIYLGTYMINGHYQVFTCTTTTPTCIVYGATIIVLVILFCSLRKIFLQ